MKPVHYEFNARRAVCGVRLTLRTFATKNPSNVDCPKCGPTARRDIPQYEARHGPHPATGEK